MGAYPSSSACTVPMPLLLFFVAASATRDHTSWPRHSSPMNCFLAAHIIDDSTIILRSMNRIPRGGGDIQFGSATNHIERESELKVEEEKEINKPDKRSLRLRSTNKGLGIPLPKRLLDVARSLIDRTARIILLRPRQLSNEDEVDHAFDELDHILESKNSTEQQEEASLQQEVVVNGEEDDWLESWPPLPQGKKQRSLRSWINKMKHKHLSSETAKALKTIRNIIDAFPDYGVVDVFGMYSPKDVIRSIMALSRLQHVLGSDTNNSKLNNNNDYQNNNDTIDKELLEELAHYCTFANAAYGWKGFAFCGRLHFGGNNRVLVRSTGIDKRDIVTANWHSKANRPAYYIVRDIKRKAIVMGIRGSLSPRDILTDLCASSENFIAEDDPNIGDIGEMNNSSTTPPLIIGRAHKGMVDAAKSVARMTGKTISDELDAQPDFSLVIVGHSLGGGVAAIIAAMWKRRFMDRVRSIGYGNPCVFPLNITKEFDNIITVEGKGDPFATISLGHIADVTKAISKLCQDKGLRDEILKRTDVGFLKNPKDIPRDDYEWCANAMIFLRKQMDSEKLLPPGKIYQMAGPLLEFQTEGNASSGRLGGDTATLKSVDPIIFNELKLYARMFDVSLHIPIRYEMLLRRLASSEV